MRSVTLRELCTKTAAIRKALPAEREIVVTANGRPFAVITPTDPEHLEGDVRCLRLARFGLVVKRIQARSVALGLDKMTMAEIDEIIAEVRREKRGPTERLEDKR